MAELAAAHFQTLKSQTSCLEMEPIFNNFTFSDQDPSFHLQFMMNENFMFNQIQTLEFNRNLGEPSVSADGGQTPLFHQIGEQRPLFLQMGKDTVKAELQECNRKRKPTMDVSESSSGTASSHVRADRNTKNGKSRRRKIAEKEEEELKEVVHVRARRGQATDSHSLAERVRRGKINERLKCLQNIVPGCYKTMGMAVMLDEIINYVQSLQNQVEFLSMKLSAASSFYDFSSEQEMERLMRIGGQDNHFSTTTWQP